MKQLDIQFFWPLTEQIPLDLDFNPSHEYETKRRAAMIHGTVSITDLCNGTFTLNETKIPSSFTIDIDEAPLTVTSTKTPNIFRQYLYKILGVRWKPKC